MFESESSSNLRCTSPLFPHRYDNVTAVTNDTFTFADTARAAKWRSALANDAATGGDMWLHGYWKFDWRDTFVRVKSIEAATVATTTGPRSALALRRSPSVTPVAADDRVAPVMGAQQVGGATYFTVCAPFSRDDPGQFYYNNTKDGNSTSPWIPFAKHPTWAGNTYTSRPWFQTGLFYYDINLFIGNL